MVTELTLQRYFDETVEYLSGLTSDTRAVGIFGCVYLTPGGRKCAVGYWIPDGHEAQEEPWVEMGIGTLCCDFPELAGIAWPDCERGVELAEHLQALHDEGRHWTPSGPSQRFWERVDWIASMFSLEPYDRKQDND